MQAQEQPSLIMDRATWYMEAMDLLRVILMEIVGR